MDAHNLIAAIAYVEAKKKIKPSEGCSIEDLDLRCRVIETHSAVPTPEPHRTATLERLAGRVYYLLGHHQMAVFHRALDLPKTSEWDKDKLEKAMRCILDYRYPSINLSGEELTLQVIPFLAGHTYRACRALPWDMPQRMDIGFLGRWCQSLISEISKIRGAKIVVHSLSSTSYDDKLEGCTNTASS